MSQIYSAFPRRALAGAALHKAGLYVCKRNSLFVPPRPGNEQVLKVLPYGRVLFQVEDNGHSATFLVDDEADSGHALLVFHGKLTPVTSSASVQQKQIAAPNAAKPPGLR